MHVTRQWQDASGGFRSATVATIDHTQQGIEIRRRITVERPADDDPGEPFLVSGQARLVPIGITGKRLWLKAAATQLNVRIELSSSTTSGPGAPIDSPIFSGDPQGPTPPALDNDGSLATTGWVQSEMDRLNVKLFGAIGNGTTDDTVAIKAAISQARATNEALYFPPGRYRCTNQLDVAGETGPLEMYGPQATLLHDYPSSQGLGLFRNANGVIGPNVAVTVGIVAGATTVTVASGATFAARDYIRIIDKAVPHYSTLDDIVGYEGEVLRIESVAGNVLTVVGAFEENYALFTGTVGGATFADDNVQINKLTLVTGLNIHDISFEGLNGDPVVNMRNRAIVLSCYLDAQIRNVHFKNFINDCMRFEFFVDFRVTDCTFEDLSTDAGYGLHVRQGTSGHYVRPVARHCRHIFTTGDGGPGPTFQFETHPRHVDVIGGRVYGNAAAAYDTHGNGKYIRFIDCADYSHKVDASGGDSSFQVRCKNASVINPHISGGGQDNGVRAEPGATNFILSGGEIRGVNTGVWIHGCDNASVTNTRIWPKAGATTGILVERIVGYNYPMVSNHIANVSITGDANSPCLNGISYTSTAWQNGWTLDIDPLRIRNCTNTVSGASMAISIADDAVYVVKVNSSTFSCGLLFIWSTSNTPAPVPNGIIRYRTGTSAVLTQVAMASTTNIVTTTGVLTGTTGTDGNFTISAHTDGNLYFENRAGAVRVIGIKLAGPA